MRARCRSARLFRLVRQLARLTAPRRAASSPLAAAHAVALPPSSTAIYTSTSLATRVLPHLLLSPPLTDAPRARWVTEGEGL
ncbi:hypothetical protein GUJ93_ZPchr2162g18761 [Zizania palustris]|uniref:Uncharacterized protein n=1 Tax=Zizania palustris TaxID=103762 RepID=A0A8J5R1N2_ZIZPA|nr:hypothetical protein GUJ93_ZPchr2162g18761 [Zizania palustris]